LQFYFLQTVRVRVVPIGTALRIRAAKRLDIMKRILTILGIFGGISLSHAAILFDANLDPFQEVPPHNTPGFGSAEFTLNGTTFGIDAGTGVYADLLAGATAVRLQDATVGANGPVISTFTLDTPGNTSGTFSGSVTLTTTQITDLQNGNLYVNISDSVFPSGEIRGQILAVSVPEPSYALAVFGATSLILLAKRRQKTGARTELHHQFTGGV
jgi:CHRD domain